MALHPKRTLVIARIIMKPRIDHILPIQQAAADAMKKLNAQRWSTNKSHALLVSFDERYLCYVTHQIIQFQTLTLEAWEKNEEVFLELMAESASKVGEKITDFVFETRSFVPMEMTASEIHDLYFGTISQPRTALNSLVGDVVDGQTTVVGVREKMTVTVEMSPMTAANVAETLSQVPNFSTFKDEGPYDSLSSYADPLKTDCFYVRVLVENSETERKTYRQFVRAARTQCDQTTESAVRVLTSLPTE